VSDLFTTGARRNGRSLQLRWQTEAIALRGGHVHALNRDGRWCVTWQPAGFFLWARIPRSEAPGA
jgi:hypothetical protein